MCLYMCIYFLCKYVRIYISIYVYTYTCVYICLYTNTHTVHINIYISNEPYLFSYSHLFFCIFDAFVWQKMLDYLRERRDVGFFQSMAGLMRSCRWVNLEKSSDQICQTSQREAISQIPVDKNVRFAYCMHLLSSVLDLNAFERQNKAEGLGTALEQLSGTVSYGNQPCQSGGAHCDISSNAVHRLNSNSKLLSCFPSPFAVLNFINSCRLSHHSDPISLLSFIPSYLFFRLRCCFCCCYFAVVLCISLSQGTKWCLTRIWPVTCSDFYSCCVKDTTQVICPLGFSHAWMLSHISVCKENRRDVETE